jgi:GAF domain-containing protein
VVEYDLAGTSCGAVIAKKEIVYCPTGVCDIWPLEREYDRDSYLGVPMFDSTGKIIGHFACMDGKPMRQDLPHLALFKIFSVRAAAELERTLLRQKLGVS